MRRCVLLLLLIFAGCTKADPPPEPVEPKATAPTPAAPVPPTRSTAEPPEAATTPAPEAAIVRTAAGLFRVTADGRPPQPLAGPKGTLTRCVTDARAGGVWVAVDGPDQGPDTLFFVDVLRDEGVRPVVVGLPDGIEELIIDHGEAGRLGGADGVSFQVAVALRMRAAPAVEPEIGCKGDGAWSCYDGGEPPLLPELEAQRKAVAALKVVDPAWLASIVKRAASRPLWRVVQSDGAELPRVAVDRALCQIAPEDCGRARPVPGTPYWRVITANDRGDFFYQDEQLYDPQAKVFFDLAAPEKRSPTPLAESSGIEGVQISPSGQAYAHAGRIGRFDGKPVQAPADAQLCGWVGPALRIGGPRG